MATKGKDLKIIGTRLLEDTLVSNRRFVVHVGGTRSSKSYSIAQRILVYLLENSNKTVTVVRKTLPALKSTALRDFKEVLNAAGLWKDELFNKTELQYTFGNGNLVEFISIDSPAKVRGRKRNMLWLNEANEIDDEDFKQLVVRTDGQVILDLNPSDPEGWWWDLLEKRRNECTLIESTYKDNPFLSQSQIREIESYRTNDPDWFAIFGDGRRPGVGSGLIYSHNLSEHIPVGLHTAIGLDFGYTHPSAMVRCHFGDGEMWVEQLIYESYLTIGELALRVKQLINPGEPVWADAARPDAIEEIRRLGMDIRSANKDVTAGIDAVKRYKLWACPGGPDLVREFKAYRYKKDSAGRVLEAPVKLNDDLMDAMRYAAFNERKKSMKMSPFRIDIIR